MANNGQPWDRSTAHQEAIDDAFGVLRDRDRRYALYFLLEHETASLEEVADVVTGWTRTSTYGMAGRGVRDRIYRELVHRHVPMMVDAGVVEYDAETDTITMAPCPRATRSFVRLACVAETGS